MPKSADIDKIIDDVETEDDDFGAGIDDENPESSSEEGQATASSDEDSDEGNEGIDISPPADDEPDPITFRGLASEYGFELPESDDETELAQGFLQQTARLRDWAQQAQQKQRQYEQQLQHLQYQLSQGYQQQQPQQPTEQKPPELTGLLKHWSNVPEFHDEWLNYVTYDDQQNLVAKPGADPTLPQKIEAYNRWQRQAQQSMLSNPQQFVFESLQANPGFQEVLQQQIQQAVYGLQDQLQAQRVSEQRAPHLYEPDGHGGKQLSAAGQAYFNAVQLAETKGLVDTDTLDQIGWTAALPYVQAAQRAAEQQQQEPETPSETKRKKQLSWSKQQAKRNNNRGGSASQRQKTKPAPRNEADLERNMLEAAQAAGIDLSGSAV